MQMQVLKGTHYWQVKKAELAVLNHVETSIMKISEIWIIHVTGFAYDHALYSVQTRKELESTTIKGVF
jgi:hypothetical protein